MATVVGAWAQLSGTITLTGGVNYAGFSISGNLTIHVPSGEATIDTDETDKEQGINNQKLKNLKK